MPVHLEGKEEVLIDFGRDASGTNVLEAFPPVYRYEQLIADVDGYDPQETGGVLTRVHYGYAPHPVIRIANILSSTSHKISHLGTDRDGDIWLLCHKHRSAEESAAYAHAMLMARDPADGLAPAAIEYVSASGIYSIVTRKAPWGAPPGMIVYGVSRPSHQAIMTVAFDDQGRIAYPEPYLFAYAPLPQVNSEPRMDR